MADHGNSLARTGKHVPLKLDIRIEEGKFEKGAGEILKVLCPLWKEKDVNLQQLTEGHLNKMYVASVSSVCNENSIIIRVPSDANNAIFDRERERICVRLLNDLGLSSPLLAEFTNGVCFGYLPGETFTRDLAGADIVYHKRKKMSWSVARELAHYHSSKTMQQASSYPIPKDPKEIKLFRALLDQLPTRADYHTDDTRNRYFAVIPDRATLVAEVDRLEKMMEESGADIVFSHGDLVPPNVVYDEQNDKATFVDYEFAGYNYRPIDFVNFFLGSAGLAPDPAPHYVDDAYRRHFIREYLQELWRVEGREGEPSDDDVTKLKNMCDKFMLCVELRYVLFPAILCTGDGHAAHKGQFDYIGLTIGRYQHYKRMREQHKGRDISS